MSLLLPQPTDHLDNPGHSFLHRVVAVDDGADEQSIIFYASQTLIQTNLVLNNGNLGINVSNPQCKLDIVGQYRSQEYNTIGNSRIDWDNGNSQFFDLQSETGFTFNNGRAGGKYMLRVYQHGAGQVAFNDSITWLNGGYNGLPSAQGYYIFSFYYSDDVGWTGSFMVDEWQAAGNVLFFQRGQVVIGNSSGSGSLSLYQNNFDNAFEIYNNDGALVYYNDGYAPVWNLIQNGTPLGIIKYSTPGGMPGIIFYTGTGDNRFNMLLMTNSVSYGGRTHLNLQFNSDSSGYNFGKVGLNIFPTGQITIGSNTAVNLLDVFGSVAIGSYAGINAAPSNGLIISGNVGIGQTSATYKLDITSPDANGLRITRATASIFRISLGGTDLSIGNDKGSTGTLSFFTAGNVASPTMQLSTDSKVGIGRSPSYSLDVNQDIFARRYLAIGTYNASMVPGYSGWAVLVSQADQGILIDVDLATSVSNGRVFSFLAHGETVARGVFYSNGTYACGPGGSTTLDTFLIRSAAATFKIAGSFDGATAGNLVTNGLEVDADNILMPTDKTPASAAATGTKGMIAKDGNYIYICTAANTWKRAAVTTW